VKDPLKEILEARFTDPHEALRAAREAKLLDPEGVYGIRYDGERWRVVSP
jgi:hypothetical protein